MWLTNELYYTGERKQKRVDEKRFYAKLKEEDITISNQFIVSLFTYVKYVPETGRNISRN